MKKLNQKITLACLDNQQKNSNKKLLRVIIACFVISIPMALKAQLSRKDIEPILTEIKSLDLSEDSSSGYDVMAEKIGDSRIVLLGEQSHGHGRAFVAKTKVIKYLVENKGFDVIAFESGFYELNKIWESNLPIVDKLVQIRSEIYPAWSEAEELNAFFDFVKETVANGKEIDLTGIDCKHDLQYGQNNYVLDFDAFLQKVKLPVRASSDYLGFKTILEGLIKWRSNFKEDKNSRPAKKEYRLFMTVLDAVRSQLTALEPDNEVDFWIQETKSLNKYAVSTWVASALKGSARLASRDSAMAENLIWLANNKYKGRKIIVWAASYHTAKEKQELTFYKAATDEVELMGSMVNVKMPGQVYSLNFISGGGSYGDWFNQKFHTYPINFNSGFLEKELASMPYQYAFIDLKNLSVKGKFLMRGISFFDPKAAWNRVFDGLFYIKEMKPPTYIKK